MICIPNVAQTWNPQPLARLQVDCDDLNDLTRPTRGDVTDRIPSAIEDSQAKHVHVLLGLNVQMGI